MGRFAHEDNWEIIKIGYHSSQTVTQFYFGVRVKKQNRHLNLEYFMRVLMRVANIKNVQTFSSTDDWPSGNPVGISCTTRHLNL